MDMGEGVADGVPVVDAYLPVVNLVCSGREQWGNAMYTVALQSFSHICAPPHLSATKICKNLI